MKLTKIFLTVFIFLSIFTTRSLAATVVQGTCDNGQQNGEKVCYGNLTDIPTIFANVLNVVLILAAFASFAMLIFGGFRFIIAQGDPKAVQAARGTLTWAVVGLVMIIVSWLLLAFLAQFLGMPNLTHFCFGVGDNGKPCY